MSAATAFIIAGPSRCGKSTLAHKLNRRIDAQWIAVDALTKALHQSGLSDVIGAPSIIENTTVDEWLDSVRNRDRAAAKYIVPVIKNVLEVQHSSLIVDNALWAEDIANLDVPVRAVFCVDTGDDNVERLRAIRDAGDDSPNNWHYHRSYTDEKIDRWADFNRARSKVFASHAALYGYPLFDLAEYGSFDELQDAALESLLAGYEE